MIKRISAEELKKRMAPIVKYCDQFLKEVGYDNFTGDFTEEEANKFMDRIKEIYENIISDAYMFYPHLEIDLPPLSIGCDLLTIEVYTNKAWFAQFVAKFHEKVADNIIKVMNEHTEVHYARNYNALAYWLTCHAFLDLSYKEIYKERIGEE